ncbi:hypothetical protein [Enterobacter sp.]|uniref:hypothetical protein n=1 Tax=Enterobacter sp. TaxID=42895 RepID=UPI00296E6D55|nr:hypothetical protein [Enterobacter sp.]
MKKYVKWAAAIAVVGALAGCANTAPIANIHSTVSAGHTESQVRNAILKAGAERKWAMNDAGKGVIVARQQARDHMAEVRVSYSASNYSITYASSTNLEAANGKINKNYNRWVHNLDKDIQVNLSATPGK